jgi:uncharacterized phage protein gp47/JayE
MPQYPLATLAPTVTAAGITMPAFTDILNSLITSYQLIYGSDTNLDPSTQDGQWIAIQALGIYNNGQGIIAVYLSYSPTYAQGIQLSSMVKINGLRRQTPTNSTTQITVVGQAGITILNGIFTDQFGNPWTYIVTSMPGGGSISVTATCQTLGDVVLPMGSTTIGPGNQLDFVTIVPGLQSITTTTDAITGAPIETDAALRNRQSISTGNPAQTPLAAIVGTVAAVTGVTSVVPYENDTSITDANGVPPHSIALVIIGGNSSDIATAIQSKKNPGTGTYGTTQVVVLDQSGVPDTINFFYETEVQIYFQITIAALQNYTSSVGTLILASVAQYINNLPSGQNVEWNKLWSAANLSGTAAVQASGLTASNAQAQLDTLSTTFEISTMFIGLSADPSSGINDIGISFNEGAVSSAANGTLLILPA